MKAIPQTTTATFRQLLAGQLVWLECCPQWACAEVYAQRIHPLIVAEYRENREGIIADLVRELNAGEAGSCGWLIANWLDKTAEKTNA